MLRNSPVLHPPLLAGLARSGHGSRVLVADANYPITTKVSRSAEIIYLNLRPGLITVDQAIAAVAAILPVEAVALIAPPEHEAEPPAHAQITPLLPLPPTKLQREPFYELAGSHDVTVAIATGDTRLWACLLFTVGTVRTLNQDVPRSERKAG